MGTDDAQQPKSRRVRQHTQGSRQPLGILSVEGSARSCGQQSASILWMSFTLVILTVVDMSVNHIDGHRCAAPQKEVTSDCCPEDSCPSGCCETLSSEDKQVLLRHENSCRAQSRLSIPLIIVGVAP